MFKYTSDLCGCEYTIENNVLQTFPCLRHLDKSGNELLSVLSLENIEANLFYKNWTNDELNYNFHLIEQIKREINNKLRSSVENTKPSDFGGLDQTQIDIIKG